MITQLYAATLTLNNNVPSAGQYTSWINAQNAANDGDTILIHGSTYDYYSINITKRLVIIGPGHHAVDKQNPQKAFCDNVLFSTGSNGTKVYGMEASNMQSYSYNVDSISIFLCRINDGIYFAFSACDHWLVDGNVFPSSGNNINAQANAVGDLVCRNNVFNGIIFSFNGVFIGYNYLNNNLFLSNTPYTFQYINNFYVNNNIFYRAGVQTYASTGITFTKNCSYQCVGGNNFPNGVNYQNVDPQFVSSLGTGAFFDYATDYHLQTTSLLINAGSDGTDVGIYGGYGDYDQNGIPHNPYIKTFNLTGAASINAGDPLPIYIKAKVRN